MRSAAGCVALALVALAAGCSVGGEAKSVEYITLDAGPTLRVDGVGTPARTLRVVVERFHAPEIYDDKLIGWREGALIQHFKFCRWAGAPTEMLQEVFARALDGTGRFEHVERSTGTRGDAPFVVRGAIDAVYFTPSSTAGIWELRLEGRATLIRQDPAKRGDPGTVLAEWPLVEPGKEGAFTAAAAKGDEAIAKALGAMVDAAAAYLRERAGVIAKDAADRIAAQPR